MKLVSRSPVDAVDKLAAPVVDRPDAQLPDNLHFRVAVGREGIGQRDQADVVLSPPVLDVVLDDDATADYLDVDKHPLAILGARGTRRDVGWRAALILGIGQVE